MRFQFVQVGSTIENGEKVMFLFWGFGCNEDELLVNGIPFVLFSVPPITPVLELDGVEAFEPLASVGQQLKLVCKAQGGNLFPALAFMLNGERAEADNKEMLEYGGYNAVHTFTAEDHHANMEMDVLYTCGIKSSNSQF